MSGDGGAIYEVGADKCQRRKSCTPRDDEAVI